MYLNVEQYQKFRKLLDLQLDQGFSTKDYTKHHFEVDLDDPDHKIICVHCGQSDDSYLEEKRFKHIVKWCDCWEGAPKYERLWIWDDDNDGELQNGDNGDVENKDDQE